MKVDKLAIICNPYAGSGKKKIFEHTENAFKCFAPQVGTLFSAPGEMGEIVCQGANTITVGSNSTKTRVDTIETTKAMIDQGAELFVVVAGDGTYSDVVEGMKAKGVTLPIFGIAAGRFNTVYPKRKHDPFVSLRGEFRDFSLEDLEVEDVMGILSSVNGDPVSYGFFWAVVSNAVAYSKSVGDDYEPESFMTIDARKYLHGEVEPIDKPIPVATEDTRMVLLSQHLGELEFGRGPNISMPMVAHVVDEVNQIVAAGFGMFANLTGYHGVSYYFTNPDIYFMPGEEFFPVEMKCIGFYEGDKIRFTGLKDGSVLQADSTSICQLSSNDVLTIEIELDMGKKAVFKSKQ
jgi:hypothetical protein